MMNKKPELLNDILEETEELIKISLRVSKRPFDRLTALSGVEGLKRKRDSHSRFGIGILKTNEIKLWSEATSLFDVQRWTFDVRCSVCSMLNIHL